MDIETAAFELLQALDATFDDEYGVSIVDTMPGAVQDAVADLRKALEPAVVDTQALAALIANIEWEPRDDYGPGAMIGIDHLIPDALHWECTSCRPDVGWPNHALVVKSADGTITIYIECGHCGNQYAFDVNGNVID